MKPESPSHGRCSQLRHQWTDGTTHLVFDPIELLERLTALTPRPHINLVLYYGVLACSLGLAMARASDSEQPDEAIRTTRSGRRHVVSRASKARGDPRQLSLG